jgi:hypothetical protein
LGAPGVSVGIILKLNLKKCIVKMQTGFSRLRRNIQWQDFVKR